LLTARCVRDIRKAALSGVVLLCPEICVMRPSNSIPQASIRRPEMRPIAEVASRFVLLVPFVLLSFDVTGAADNSEKQAKALNLIIDFTNSICETVKQEGTSRDVELSGEVKAELNWLLKRLANLGSKAAVRYQDSTYQGVLQEQLAGQLNKIRDCKKELALVLQARLLPEAQKPELPKPPDITPSDRSERQLALISTTVVTKVQSWYLGSGPRKGGRNHATDR
jgi:hypothetical protein